jgi:hypothetical protein
VTWEAHRTQMGSQAPVGGGTLVQVYTTGRPAPRARLARRWAATPASDHPGISTARVGQTARQRPHPVHRARSRVMAAPSQARAVWGQAPTQARQPRGPAHLSSATVGVGL